MRKIFFFSLFMTTTLFAKEPLSINRVNNKLILSSANCDLLNVEAQNLRKWREQRKENPLQDIKISKTAKGCSIELNNIAPDFVEKYHGKNAKGPNCWNTTLTLNGMLPGKRFSIAEEMTFWMQSPLCKPISAKELRAGDIGAMRYYKADKTFSEDHGFIYISDNLIFHKPGPGAEESYGIYDKNKLFKESQSDIKTDYFRCMSIDDYLKNKPILEKNYVKINAALLEIECKEEKNIFTKQANPEWLGTNIAILDKLVAESLKESMPKSDDSKFLWNSLLVRVNSLKAQLAIDKH